METLEKIIINNNIKVISFDIFDTLLERPCIYPSDIFSLLNNPASNIINDNFYEIRKNIEQEAIKEANNVNLTIYDIYNFLSKKYDLKDSDKQYLCNLEIELEKTVLSSKKCIKELYDLAVKHNKKVICISDMYLTSEILSDILKDKNYDNISHIYVSSEIKKRKDDGELFKYVLEKESIHASELLHIGDNKISDFEIPLKMGIPAYYIPSSFNDFCNYKYTSKYSNIYTDKDNYSPSERVLIGFMINKIMEYKSKIKENEIFSDCHSLGYHILGPMLFFISCYILNNQEIQNNYSYIHFASRDGFLPMKAYNKLIRNGDKYLKSKYIYAGRRLYNVSNFENNILDYLTSNDGFNEYYTIKNLLISRVGTEIIEIIDLNKFNLDIKYYDDKRNNYSFLNELINEYKDDITKLLNQKKENLYKYYNDIIELKNDRAIVFDIGYSGSISIAIEKIINKKIDKIYIWQFTNNPINDIKYSQKTYCLYKEINSYLNRYLNIFYEELFSPLEKSCIEVFNDGNNNFKLIFDESESFSDNMIIDLNSIHNGALKFIDDINDLLGKYLSSFEFITDNLMMKSLIYLQESITDKSLLNLKNIKFEDKAHRADSITLKDKLDISNHPFYKSRFVDKTLIKNYSEITQTIKTNKNIAIHIHAYHIDILYEIADYLKYVNQKFDLLISVSSEQNKKLALILLNKNILSNLNNIIIKITPNKGRDVAPWIVAFKNEQANYDYVCHIHTKKSYYTPWTKEWRNYLYDNLISKEAIDNIINIFEQNTNIGVIFPPYFPNLYDMKIELNVNFFKDDEIKIVDLLNKMYINTDNLKDRIIFSGGTMFWYRVDAFKKLFDLNLTYDDFEEEPIDIKGTLPHAIERLPAVVSEASGYDTILYINNSYLLETFFHDKYISPLIKNIMIENRENGSLKIENNILQNNLNDLKLKSGWFSLFNIYSNPNTLRIVIFGIKLTFKVKKENIEKIIKIIPIKKLRYFIINKFV